MKAATALALSLAILALFFAFLLATRRAGARSGETGLFWDEPVESFVRRQAATTYVDVLDEYRSRQAFYRAMDAYLRFDRYSEFIPPDRYRQWQEETRGSYAGLGVRIEGVSDGLHILGVWSGGPADQAGLKVGETILRAGGQDLAGLQVEQITPLLKGAPGTQVRLSVRSGPRPSSGTQPVAGAVREVVVQRGVIHPPTVYVRLVGPSNDVGVVRLTDFAEETLSDFQGAVTRLVREEHVRGIVLDVRDNGGGVLSVATSIVDRFVEGGIIVRMGGRGAGAGQEVRATPQETDLLRLPLVVLVNGASASASEIVAGALQDARRAVIVGERTYGKFVVQSITEIPGRPMAVKLTTARYVLASGRSYQGPANGEAGRTEPAGLLPDVVVPLGRDEALRLQQQWANQEAAPWGEAIVYPDVPAQEVDPQLQRAVDLVLGLRFSQPLTAPEAESG